MKFWDILLTANANLARNKVRTILTIIAVFIGAFTITLTAAVNAGVNGYINKELGTIGGKNLLVVQARGDSAVTTSGPKKYDPNQSKTSGLGVSLSTLTDKDVTKLKTVKNVIGVYPQYIGTLTWAQNSAGGDKYQLAVNQMENGVNVDLVAGKAPDNTASDNQIDLITGYAKSFGFKSDADAVGKTLTLAATTPLGQIQTVTAKIVGVQNDSIVSSGGSMINNALMQKIYDINTAGEPDSVRNQYLAVTVEVKHGLTDTQLNNVRDSINKLGSYSAQTVSDELGTVSTIINAITIALIGFGAIALVAASFGVINTLFMAVQERTKEIGLMKAMGMSGKRVFLLFSVEAILLGFWGSVIGVVAAFFAGQGINHVANATFLKDLKGFTLLEFPPAYVGAIIIVIMLIAYLAGTLPARRASRQNPIDALRYE